MSQSDHLSGRRAGAIQAITLLLQCTLGVMGTAILAPVIPAMIGHFQTVPGVEFWAPLVVTIPSLCIAMCAPLVGYLSDIFGRRRLLIGSLVIYGLVGPLPYVLTTIPQMLASRIVLGVVEAAIMTISTTLIGDYFSNAERDKWLGYQTAVASATAVGMLALGGYLGDFGWKTPFLLYVAAFPLLLLVVLFTWEPQRPGTETSQAAWSQFPWRAMSRVAGMTLIGSMMFYVVQIQLSVALHDIGITRPSEAGLYTALVSIGIPVGTVIFQRISHWTVARLISLDFAVMALGFLGIAHSNALPLFLAMAALNQIGCGLLLPTLLTWAMRELAFEQRGRGIGVFQAVLSLGPPLGPAFVTAIAVTNGWRTIDAFGVLGLISGGVALLALLMTRPGKRRVGIQF